jgi:hypothetical protein
VNERNLSRRLSTSVVDALKAHGHILVVKGGAAALARELDELMAPEIAIIAPRIRPVVPLVGEPTSTFGDETVDQAVEDMVIKLTYSLMNSDHVEDVFAEDAVIRRDIFRVVRDGLREPPGLDPGDDQGGETSVVVQLDDLGYVASTAGRAADASTLRQALDRAASTVQARFIGFRPEQREATFRLEGGGPDERLELEEAVADELTDLVEQGIIELPTLERRVELGRALSAADLRALRPKIDAAAQATLRRAPCHASWEMADARTIRVLFTPLSEQDARGIDAPAAAFGREVAALLASTPTSASTAASTTPRPPAVAAKAPRAESSAGGEKPRAAAEPASSVDEAARRRKTARSRDGAEAPPAAAAGAAAAAAAAKPSAPARKRPSAKAAEAPPPARSSPKARKAPAKKR